MPRSKLQPATITMSYEARDALKRLTAMIGFAADRPVTYGYAIMEAEHIVRERLNEELTKTVANTEELTKAGAA
jgi:hypothetical protein